MEFNKEPRTISMPLDITHFAGEADGRILPWILFIVGTLLPLGLYLLVLIRFIPWQVWLVIQIVITLNVGLMTIGDERTRLKKFKAQLYDEYSSVTDMMDIKTFHEDGLIEYTNMTVAYVLSFLNNDASNDSVRIGALINMLEAISVQKFDVRVYNINTTDVLKDRYEKLNKFTNNDEVARGFLETLDANRQFTKDNTLVTKIAIIVYDHTMNHKTLRSSLELICQSRDAKLFKDLKIEDLDGVYSLLAEDFDTNISPEDIQMKKYSQGEYLSSRVIGYGEDYNESVEDMEEELDFMIED